MAPVAAKRRRVEDEVRRPKKKVRKFKKQAQYHSSSEEEEPASGSNATDPKPRTTAVTSQPKPILKHAVADVQPEAVSGPTAEEDDVEEGSDDELARNTALNMEPAESSEEAEDDEAAQDAPETDATSASEDDEPDSESETSMTSSNRERAKKKRNDPTAFATSISKILDTKLATSKRRDPVLSRSKSAAEANKSLADEKLEQKARAQIRSERKVLLEKGRVKDVLGLETSDVDTGAILEEEKRLKKTAQRGVVKLFNAVRAAQVKAEVAMKEARQHGVVGMKQREEHVNEMSKQGFLDLISAGGNKAKAAA